MPNRRNIHATPNGRGGWQAIRAGASQPISQHRTQRAAEQAAQRIARSEGGESFTHRPNGQIRDRDSFGNDPAPPIDKKH